MLGFGVTVFLAISVQLATPAHIEAWQSDEGVVNVENITAFAGKQSGNLCLAEHNKYRQRNGRSAIAYDSKLETAARRHNDVMTSQNCFSHQCSGEPSLGSRVTSAGYRWSGVAENIAAGQRDCESAMDSWMNSSGHRRNILGNYRHVGCAAKQCSSGCNYPIYWTCVFGSPW